MAKSTVEPIDKIQNDRKFLQSVFDKIPGMIYVHDMVNDVNLYRSWSLKRILGYDESKVLYSGKGIRGLVHREDEAIFRKAATDLLNAADNECVQFTYRMQHHDGFWLWIRSEEYVYERDKAGKPIKVLGYAVDLTTTINEQKVLDQENKASKLLLEAAQILSNPTFKYKDALKKLAKLVSLYLNVVCDISVLETGSGVIKPEAIYYENEEVRNIIKELFKTMVVKKGQGLVGSVIETGKEVLINELPESMKHGPRQVDPRIVPKSLMYVPLNGGRSVLGSLNLTRLEGHEAFSLAEIEQIRRLGEYLSLFVENSLLHQQQVAETARRKTAENQLAKDKKWAEFKLEISTILAEVELDLTTILHQFAKKISNQFNAVCDVQLADANKGEILMVALYHPDKKITDEIEKVLKRTSIKIGEGLVGKVVSTGEEFVRLELPKELRAKADANKVSMSIMPTSMAYIPLKGHHEILGTLDVTRLQGEQAMTPWDIEQLRDLADHAAKFIENRVLQIRQKREIDLRRKAEQKLERAGRVLERMEAETRAILNAIPIYIARVSKDYRYLFLNEAYHSMGVDPRTMEGRYINEVVGEDLFQKINPFFDKVLKGETVTYDYDGAMADGRHRYFNVALAPDYSENGEIVGFYSCASDITTKVQAELESQLTQDRLETLSLNSGDAFFFHNSKQQIIDVNQVATDMLGFTRDQFLSMTASDIDPRWNGVVYQKFLNNLDVNTPQTFDTHVFHQNGTKIPVEVRFVKRLEGEQIYIQSLVRDRTEKREQELKLQRSEERLRLIFENVEDYIATVNEQGVFESINKTSQGLGQDEVIGTSIYDFYDNIEKKAALKKQFQTLRETGKTFRIEDSYTGPDGSTVMYTRKFIGIFHGDSFFKAILIIRDVTAERDREKSIMNAVVTGQEQERKRLGAELHDGIGQVLSAIALQVSQINEQVNDEDYLQVVDEMQLLTGNLHAAIREVRNISHDLMPEVLESFGLKEAMNQTCSNLHDRTGIKVSFNHADLESRYNQLVEVNLYRITQELLNNIQKHAQCKNVFVNLMDYGDSLNLTIEDDGIGFNLKAENEFKGIGLSNVFSRVSMMGGQIDVESAENSGTLVNIEVPKKIE